MKFAIFTRAEAPQFQKLLLWLTGLPAKGVQVAGGQHAPIDEAPADLKKRTIAGWTTRYVDWVAHPLNTGIATDQFAVRVTPAIEAVYMEKRGQLSAAQRSWVEARVTPAAALDPSWQSAEGNIVESTEVEPE